MISEVSQELFYKLNDEAPQILSDYYAHRNLLRSLKFTNEDRPLGCGSFASVLHAAIGATGRRKVAVKYFKKLSPEFNEKESEEQTKNIKNEVALMKLMRRGSRHLVRYIDCLELPGKVYLVMELCSAGDLENMLFTRRRLKEEEIKCIARQMLSALKFLHDMGIIHGGNVRSCHDLILSISISNLHNYFPNYLFFSCMCRYQGIEYFIPTQMQSWGSVS